MAIMRRAFTAILFAALCAIAAWLSVPPEGNILRAWAAQSPDHPVTRSPDLKGSYRFERGGWVFVHLEGSPHQIGYQHGYLLAAEILDAFQAVKLRDTHDTHRDWNFFRQTAREMLWPQIDREYQEELQGIAEGLKAKGVAVDIDDVVALNGFEEVPDYFVPWYDA
jgi:hypothetical protein